MYLTRSELMAMSVRALRLRATLAQENAAIATTMPASPGPAKVANTRAVNDGHGLHHVELYPLVGPGFQIVEGKLDVACGKGMTVVEPDALSQLEYPCPVILGYSPVPRQKRNHSVLISPCQSIKYKAHIEISPALG